MSAAPQQVLTWQGVIIAVNAHKSSRTAVVVTRTWPQRAPSGSR